jgi:hypothetical protein
LGHIHCDNYRVDCRGIRGWAIRHFAQVDRRYHISGQLVAASALERALRDYRNVADYESLVFFPIVAALMTGPTPIYPIVENFVNDEYKRLENVVDDNYLDRVTTTILAG